MGKMGKGKREEMGEGGINKKVVGKIRRKVKLKVKNGKNRLKK